MADWFTAEGLTDIAMEATGSPWRPVWYVLEDRPFRLELVNAQHVKILPGRTSDVLDAEWLAEVAKGKLRTKIPALRQALRGRFRDHHATLIRLCLDHLAYLEGAITELDERIDALIATHTSEAGLPVARARDRLDTITGVGKRAAECILAEIGVDMARFPTAAHMASWAGACPRNNITGGTRGSGTTTHGDVWLLDILTQCAWAAAHTRDTYLAAQFWRLARRIGKKKAAIAVAHSILVICWHLLTDDCDDCDDHDLGGDYFTRRNVDRQRDRLIAQLQGLGYRVILDKAAQDGCRWILFTGGDRLGAESWMPAPHPPEFRQRAVELARLRENPISEMAKDSVSASRACGLAEPRRRRRGARQA